MKIFLIFFFFLSNSSLANEGFKDIEDKINIYETEVIQLKASVKSLDSRLAVKNNAYLKQLELQNSIEKSLDELSAGLVQNRNKIHLKFKELKREYMTTLLFSHENNVENSMTRKILLKKIKIDSLELSNLLQRNKNLNEKITEFQTQLKGITKEKEELYAILNDLEGKKSDISENYFNSVKEKLTLESTLAKKKLEQFSKSLTPDSFSISPPIELITDIEETRKGIHFYFKENTPVLSVASGKIVYSDKLSTFGNVVMIEHNNDLRTVTLGNFTPKVSRGDWVEQGQVIGYANADELTQDQRKIYVELRKGEKPLKTAKYMNANFSEQIGKI
ncbi:MAG: peptidoglycan DD-metalloendopeptidase family protein [Halobacteriovoraceae bacterium]|nr:peptidoglycan DD-metalloendopeptidase family protein [Halobacteriovoraceae bacterium]MCB9093974.1 peptidoglycan DD-metalloendopeptidase family protein [Halobacteriovoraceae bacterium]